jgi:hypothetical protein
MLPITTVAVVNGTVMGIMVFAGMAVMPVFVVAMVFVIRCAV